MGLPLASWGRVVWQEGDEVVMFFLPCSGFLCHIMGLPLFCDVRYEKVKTQAKSTIFRTHGASRCQQSWQEWPLFDF